MKFGSLLMVLMVVGLGYGYTAPGVVWTSDSVPEIANQIVVDNSDNIYTIFPEGYPSPGTQIMIRKYSSDHTMLWLKRIDFGITRNVSVNKAIINGSEIAVTGSYKRTTSNRDTLYLQRIDLDGNALGGIPSFHSISIPNSIGYNIAVNGLTYDIVGVASKVNSNLHSDTLSHLRIWNTNTDLIYSDCGHDLGVNTDNATRVNNFQKTSNGYIICAMFDNYVTRLLSINNSYGYKWSSLCVENVYDASCCLKNDTPFVFYSMDSTFMGISQGRCIKELKFNDVFYSSTALIPNNTILVKVNTYSIASMISDPYGVFIVVNNMCIRSNFINTLWVDSIQKFVTRSSAITNEGSIIYFGSDRTSSNRRLYELDKEGIASITPLDTFRMLVNGSVPTPQVDTVKNINTGIFGPLTATITYGSGGSGWLSVGVVGENWTGNLQTIANIILNNSLPAGIYTATVTLTGNYLRTLVPTTYQVILRKDSATNVTNMVRSNQPRFGLWSNAKGLNFETGIGLYEITVCDLAGRMLYHQKDYSNGSVKIIPILTHNVYVAALKNEDQNIIRTITR